MNYYLVDVFSREKYSGNRLAVFIAHDELSSQDMQSIAGEINFSETTFIVGLDEKGGEADVRIFTPRIELDFAGHPVIGTAYVIKHHLSAEPLESIFMRLRVGSVRVDVLSHQQAPLRFMQPSAEFRETIPVERISAVLSLPESAFVESVPSQIVSTGLPHIIVPLNDRKALSECRINHDAYDRIVVDTGVKNVLAFSHDPHEEGQDISARMFAPAIGIPEDPATGSGNGCLAAYLAHHRGLPPGGFEFVVGQGYEIGRPSQLWLRVDKHGDGMGITVGGNVVEMASGTWYN